MPYATRRSYSGASAACTLTSSITSGDTTATLTGTTTAWPDTAGGSFYMVIDPGLSTEEKVLVGARSTGSLSSITRGVDGTTASSHSAGATCYPVFTAVDADQANKIASTLTTKGDILATDGSALNRLAVGTDDYALLADSSATNGVAWKQVPAAGIADRAIGSSKLNGLTLNAQTGTSYTLVLTDAHDLVTLSNGSAITLTIPTNASVAFAIGDQVNIVQIGTGQVTVGGAGVTIGSQGSKLKLNGQWSAATLIKIDTNTWVLVGNTAA
jgi:hypothetical protein